MLKSNEMKKILIPTDFSSNSLNAIHYAVEMFKSRDCEFYVLNVIKASSFISDDLLTMSPATTLYKSLINDSKQEIVKIISKIQLQNENHKFYPIVDYDNFIDAINQTCRSKQIDLIIMGTKGVTGLERILLGSNTIRVIQRCSTPVLAIPSKYKFIGLEDIVFTSNYLTLYKLKELLPLLNISRLFKSKIKILHITDTSNLSENQENNKAFLKTYFSNVEHEFIDINSKDISETVSQYNTDNNIKLLAMMSKRHSFFERLFITHKVESFTYNINTPLLVLKNAEESSI